jgi:hypothetical protein
MGNSQSVQDSSASHQHHHYAKRKRSTAFSHLTSGCTSDTYCSYEPYLSQETFVNNSAIFQNNLNEKPVPLPYVSRSDHQDISLPPPLYDEKFASADLVEDDLSLANKSFLETYPEYNLTWLLDSLRKSDFTRLDRTGEVYVDYMGGALYPESLVRLHSSFLHKSVLGNTHSANNRFLYPFLCSISIH